MNKEQLQKLIENYYLGNLSEQEELAAEEIINAPEHQTVVNSIKNKLLESRKRAEEDMQRRIDAWKANPAQKTNVNDKLRKIWKWLTWIATMSLVVTAVWYLTKDPHTSPVPHENPDQTPSAQSKEPTTDPPPPNEKPAKKLAVMSKREAVLQLAANPFATGSTTKGSANIDNSINQKDTIILAIHLLQLKKVGTALQMLHACRTCDSLDRAQWLGHGYFQMREYDKAIAEYQTWMEHGFTKKEAQWYVFLACQANNKQPADLWTSCIQALQNTKHPYHKNYTRLEDELSKIGPEDN